jgi:transposase
MPPPSYDHECDWRDYANGLAGKVDKQQEALADQQKELGQQQDELAKLKAEMAELKRGIFGKKSEKMPAVEKLLRQGKPSRRNGPAAQRKRRETAAAKQELAVDKVEHRVPADHTCPECGGASKKFKMVGHKESSEYVYVQGHFRRLVHLRHTVRCPCGDHIVTAPSPDRVGEKTSYGPSFVAHVVVSKCCDSLPFYRMEKQYKRVGVPIARSTMVNHFHRAALLLEPIAKRILALIAEADVVLADETTLRVQKRKKKGYMWTFIAGELIGYAFSPDRSGDTPSKILGGTKGTLLVDGYTGYNQVTQVDGRTRAGCLAHARRKFFDALQTAPNEANHALERILDVYRVEHEARDRDIAGTPDHLAMRQSRSRAIMDDLESWLAEQQALHPPKSPIGRAIGYARNNWPELTCFLDDVAVPPDNNASERALRVVALGRKNFLHVGHDDAGENTATLYTLTASCEAAGVNPLDYIADVLLRIQRPGDSLDDLLPHRWTQSTD